MHNVVKWPNIMHERVNSNDLPECNDTKEISYIFEIKTAIYEKWKNHRVLTYSLS